MKILRKANPVKVQVLGHQHPEPGIRYVLNPCLIVEGNAIFNPLTEEAVLVTDEARDKQALARGWYLIPEGTDIRAMTHMVRQKELDTITAPGGPKYGYTIFTTTGCNARCEYCFEKDMEVITMSEKTARDVADYIVKTHWKNGTVKIRWFGGEPLVNRNVITLICKILEEKNVNFISEILTNGELLQAVTAEEFNVWHLKKVQLTFDDAGAEYDRIKGLPDGAYDRLKEQIGRLGKLGISASARIHYDPTKGTEPVFRLIEDLKSFGNLSMYARMIYGDADPKDYKTLLQIEDRMIAAGKMAAVLPGYSNGTHCMADRKTHATIGPMGDLSPCEHYAYGPEMYGTIYSWKKKPDVMARWALKAKQSGERCAACPLYPMCEKITACPAEGLCEQGYNDYMVGRIRRALKHSSG